MGLENRFKVRYLKKEDIPNFVIIPNEKDINPENKEYNPNTDEVDIAYYRKCWGIRDDILEILHQGDEGGIYEVDAEDIPAILRKIYSYCSKSFWDRNANSIWEFEEVIDYTLIQQMINLKWLYYHMINHPEVKCYFYDSF